LAEYRLIPFTIESVTNNVKEIPEGVRMIKAPEVWQESGQGAGVVVAIIDSGCQVNHPDLQGRIIGKRNYTGEEGGEGDVTDFSGHGTHVAGTIAAIENDQGVLGVAPKASLLILKVMRRFSTPEGIEFGASNEDIIHAINDCISWRGPRQERVRVINMSLGGSQDDPGLHNAIKKAVENDIVVVCAAGNEGDFNKGGDCSPVRNEFLYPGAYSEVVEVGAIGLDRRFPCFTNTNLEVDLVAPGVDILSTFSENAKEHQKYAHLSGTSMATPHVAGAVALIINQCEREFERTLSEPEIYAQLIKRTLPLGNPRTLEGNGLLNLNLPEILAKISDSISEPVFV
jgi:major intracellular serine protease